MVFCCLLSKTTQKENGWTKSSRNKHWLPNDCGWLTLQWALQSNGRTYSLTSGFCLFFPISSSFKEITKAIEPKRSMMFWTEIISWCKTIPCLPRGRQRADSPQQIVKKPCALCFRAVSVQMIGTNLSMVPWVAFRPFWMSFLNSILFCTFGQKPTQRPALSAGGQC